MRQGNFRAKKHLKHHLHDFNLKRAQETRCSSLHAKQFLHSYWLSEEFLLLPQHWHANSTGGVQRGFKARGKTNRQTSLLVQVFCQPSSMKKSQDAARDWTLQMSPWSESFLQWSNSLGSRYLAWQVTYFLRWSWISTRLSLKLLWMMNLQVSSTDYSKIICRPFGERGSRFLEKLTDHQKGQ